MYRTVIQVRPVLVTQNIFINDVDRFNQQRSTNPIIRKERRVPMNLFKFILDASIKSIQCLRNWLNVNNSGVGVNILELKRKI